MNTWKWVFHVKQEIHVEGLAEVTRHITKCGKKVECNLHRQFWPTAGLLNFGSHTGPYGRFVLRAQKIYGGDSWCAMSLCPQVQTHTHKRGHNVLFNWRERRFERQPGDDTAKKLWTVRYDVMLLSAKERHPHWNPDTGGLELPGFPGCQEPAWGTPPMAKVMKKEAWHTQRRDQASGNPLFPSI